MKHGSRMIHAYRRVCVCIEIYRYGHYASVREQMKVRMRRV